MISLPSQPKRVCPGCGVLLPRNDHLLTAHPNASPECQMVFTELTAYTLTRGDRDFMHQYAVDAYAAQHASAASRPISAAFALMGLHLACDKGETGRHVQYMHGLLARRTKNWPRFDPPADRGKLTAYNVTQAPPGAERDAMLKHWACAVWAAWAKDHDAVKALLARVMAD